MLRSLAAAALVAILSSAASANPILTFTSTPLGGGLTAYDFTFHSNDALNNSAFASITFSTASGINQIQFSSLNVDSDTNATAFNGIAGYVKQSDSWFYAPWSANAIALNPTFPDGFNRSATSYGINAGSGTGSQITDAPFAHIVSSSAVSWSGTLSRNGVDYATSGSTAVAVPEPASLSIWALGALFGLRRKKRPA